MNPTDGRKHEEDPDPSYFGDEVGHWDGDALVVDSIGFKDTQVWADENGSPHSDALHVVERWARAGQDHIHVETLIEDPKFYTRPFTYARTWVLGKPDEQLHEYSCAENNIDKEHLGFGPGPIRPDGTRGYLNPAPLPPKRETVAKPLTEKQIKKKEAQLKKELETPWKKWLNEDVVYIITDEERKAFKQLNTDEEREQFIEQFWLRRDPTPDTEENEFREEHYRRIAYANERFASGIPGWKTDRVRIYIEYGPADEVESHPSGGTYERPYEEGGGTTSTYPFEKWRYRYIEGIGSNIILEFVDTTMSGEYHMTMDPSEKDALLYVPGAGLTMMEQMGMSCKACRFTRTDGTHLGTGSMPLPDSMSEFN